MTDQPLEKNVVSSQTISRPSRGSLWIVWPLAILTLVAGVVSGVALGQVQQLRQELGMLKQQEAAAFETIPVLVENALAEKLNSLDITGLHARLTTLQAKVSSLEQSGQAVEALGRRVTGLEGRVTDLEFGSTFGSIDASQINAPIGCSGQVAVWGPFGLSC